MEHLFKILITWLHLHPTWAGIATGLITFVESLAIIGFLIPGSVILTAVGSLVGSGVIPATSIFIFAIAGAILGDALSFWIGYRYYKTIRTAWPFSRYPGLITRGEEFFRKHGGKGIFFGRFIGAIRPLLPIIAGMLRMSPRKFLIVEIISGLLWAPVYMIPGIILGFASARFAPQQTVHVILFILAMTFIIWLLVWLIKLFLTTLINIWRACCDHIWFSMKCKTSLLYTIIYEHTDPDTSRPLSIAIFTVFFGVILLALSLAIFNHATWINNFNNSMLTFFSSFHSAEFQNYLLIIRSFLGQWLVILISVAFLLAYLVCKRDWHSIRLLCSLIIIVGIVLTFFKNISFVAAPDIINAPLTTSSFPSAAILLTLTFFGFMAFLISHNSATWIKKLTYWMCAIIVSLVCFCDLCLNILWLSDAIASLLLGGVILGIIIIAYRRHNGRRIYHPLSLALILIVSQLLFGFWYVRHYAEQLANDFQLKQTALYLEESRWWNEHTLVLPVYLINRFNRPSDVLNIEWLGTQDAIHQTLRQSGWQDTVQLSYPALKRQLKGEPITFTSPIAERFDMRKPALTMMRPIDKDRYLLLTLWRTDYHSETADYFIGTINYHLPVKHWLWRTKEQCTLQYPNPTYSLQLNQSWQIQFKPFTPQFTVAQHPCVAVDDLILMIRSS